MKKTLLYFSLFFIPYFLVAQCQLDKSGWITVFEEDFSNPSLADYSTDWRIEGNGGQDCYHYVDPEINRQKWIKISEDQMYLTSGEDGRGEMNLTAKKIDNPSACWNGETPTHSMGYLESTYDDFPSRSMSPEDWCNRPDYPAEGGFLFGMFELECKFPKSPGVNNAFWMLANNGWPTEIDVVEFGYDNPNWALSSVYFLPNVPGNYSVASCGNLIVNPVDFTDEFHTWTLVWTPSRVSWFLDGKELKTDTIAIHQPTYGFHPNSIDGICEWRKADMVINAGTSWDWGLPGEVSDPFILKSVKAYKPANLTLWEEWLTQKGLARGERKDFREYYFEEIVPVYEQVSYTNEYSWTSSTVASYDSTAAGKSLTINYQCVGDLNLLDNGKEFIYQGACNQLWKTTLNQNGEYKSKNLLPATLIDGEVKATENGSVIFYQKDQQLFFLQNDKPTLAQKVVDPVGNPCPINNACVDTLPLLFKDHLVVLNDGLQVFYRGTDNQVYTAYRSALSSNRWYEHLLSDTADCNGPVLINPLEKSTIFYPTTTGNIRQLTIANYQTIDNAIITSTAKVAGSLLLVDNGQKIYCQNIDHTLSCFTLTNTGWSHELVFAIPFGADDPTLVNNIASDLLINDSGDQLYYIGQDEFVWVVLDINGAKYQRPLEADKGVIGGELQWLPNAPNTLIGIGEHNYLNLLAWTACEIVDLPCSGEQSIVYLEEENEKEVITQNQLYPNPVGGNSLILNLMAGEDIDVRIFNTQGVLIRQQHFCLGGLQELDVAEFAQGHYFVQIVNGPERETLKFIRL